MQKTKLGISVGLLGAAIYFTGILGGYLALIVLVGYVLLFESNEWLRKTSVKAVTLLTLITLLSTIVGIIPRLIEIINRMFIVFGGTFSIPLIANIVSLVLSVIEFIKIICFLLLGIKALSQGTVRIPTVDKIIDKYMN